MSGQALIHRCSLIGLCSLKDLLCIRGGNNSRIGVFDLYPFRRWIYASILIMAIPDEMPRKDMRMTKPFIGPDLFLDVDLDQ